MSYSFEFISRKAVKKQITHPTTIDIQKISNVLNSLPKLLSQPDKILLMTNLLNSLQKTFGLHRLAVYAIDPAIQIIFKRGVPKEQKQFVHQVEFCDQHEGETIGIIGICQDGQKPQRIAFDSIV